MIDKPALLGKSDFSVVQDDVVFDGFFKMYELRLKHKKFEGGWTEEFSRLLFHRGEAAAAIVYDPVNDLIALVDQFRVGALDSPFGPWCLETVAGIRDEGESPEESILRELEEEAGVTDATLVPITKYYSSPGGCNEKIHLFCALTDLTNIGGIHGLDHENEDIFVHVLPADKVFDVMLTSRTNNAATLIALLWLQVNRQQIREGC